MFDVFDALMSLLALRVIECVVCGSADRARDSREGADEVYKEGNCNEQSARTRKNHQN